MTNRRMLWRVAAVVFIGAAVIALRPRRQQQARGTANERLNAAESPRVDSAAVAAALSRRLAEARPPLLRSDEWALVSRMYRGAERASVPVPLWGGVEQIQRRGGELIATLAAADSFGLAPDDTRSAISRAP